MTMLRENYIISNETLREVKCSTSEIYFNKTLSKYQSVDEKFKSVEINDGHDKQHNTGSKMNNYDE